MLMKLLANSNKKLFRSKVISLGGAEPIGAQIEKMGIPVLALNLSRTRPDVFKLLSLRQTIKTQNPDIIQTWMYHADLVGTLIAASIPKKKKQLSWNIRHSNFEEDKEKILTRLTVKACAHLSHSFPRIIVCNSHRGASIHKDMGYAKNKMRVIPNGFDTSVFKPNRNLYRKVREDLGLPQESLIIGMVARFHYQKNHIGFLETTKTIKNLLPSVHFVMCGKNVDYSNEIINNYIKRYELTDFVHLIGHQDNVATIMPGFDLVVSNSIVGEGFPNAVGEAMACGIPCVVTDVGDSAYIVGDTGMVIPPKDNCALINACTVLLNMNDSALMQMKKRARLRIKTFFSIKRITQEYEQLYLSMVE